MKYAEWQPIKSNISGWQLSTKESLEVRNRLTRKAVCLLNRCRPVAEIRSCVLPLINGVICGLVITGLN